MNSSFVKRLLYLLLFGLLLSSCTDEWRRAKNSSSWTSSNPTSIPYNIRMKEYKSGNLVPNPSFEEGTPLSSDTSTVQQIKKWQMIGNNVKYLENTVDTQYTESGKRVICISRVSSDETDTTGEGILSDYIPVLPANYDFSLNIKAENILPQFERLGSKLLQTINIRLLFFNDRHEEISSSIFCPYSGKFLDNGFKGYGFSNFSHIANLSWQKVHARTYHFPFFEGDFPDQCRYVKIFIGLRGSGTLWIDDVQLHFSKWNFTTSERMNWYKDSALTNTTCLLPTPQYIRFSEKLPLIIAGEDKVLYPSVVLNVPSSPQSIHAQEYLQNNLQKNIRFNYPDCKILTYKSIDHQAIEQSSIIFLFTSYASVDTTKQSKLMPGFSVREQGYFVTDTLIGQKKIIILAAKDDAGLFYGASTLSSLLDSVGGFLNNAHIIDYPAYTGRGIQIHPSEQLHTPESFNEFLDLMTNYRFNKLYLPLFHENDSNTKEHHIEQQNELHKRTVAYVKANGTLQYGIIIRCNTGFTEGLKFPSFQGNILPTEPETGFGIIKPYFDNGASFVLMLHDQKQSLRDECASLNGHLTQKGIITRTEEYLKLADFAEKLFGKIRNSYKEVRIEFSPFWNTNESIDLSDGQAQYYFALLSAKLDDDIVFIWKGVGGQTLRFDQLDLFRYLDLSGHNIMFWDNSMHARSDEQSPFSFPVHYPGKTLLCNIFEPFDVNIPNGFHKVSPHLFTSIHIRSEIDKIRIATLADYLWNPDAYVPELSLWKILTTKFGRQTAVQLVSFNDLYFKILEKILLLEHGTKEKKSLYKSTGVAIDTFEVLFSEIKNSLQSKHPQLVNELSLLVTDLKERLKIAGSEKNEPDKTIQNPQ